MPLSDDFVALQLGVEEAERAWLAAAGAERPTPALVENLLRASSEGVSAALKAGDLARADRMLRRSIAFGPTNADASVQLSQVLLKSEERAAAKRWLDYAKSLEPEHPKLQALESALAAP